MTEEYRVTPLFFEQQNYELIIEPLKGGQKIPQIAKEVGVSNEACKKYFAFEN